jgi:hypothetical protein
MRMRRTRAFAAPFILTVVTALPGCPKSGPSGGTTVHENPPRVMPDAAEPVATETRYQEWSVYKNGDTCAAMVDVDCPPPEEATCNPPPPMRVDCPLGVEEGNAVVIYQQVEGGPCYVEPADCGEGGCDPQPAECPTWE